MLETQRLVDGADRDRTEVNYGGLSKPSIDDGIGTMVACSRILPPVPSQTTVIAAGGDGRSMRGEVRFFQHEQGRIVLNQS